jgi:hypothetical protein
MLARPTGFNNGRCELAVAKVLAAREVPTGLGRIVALHHRSSASHQIRYDNRCPFFLKQRCDRTLGARSARGKAVNGWTQPASDPSCRVSAHSTQYRGNSDCSDEERRGWGQLLVRVCVQLCAHMPALAGRPRGADLIHVTAHAHYVCPALHAEVPGLAPGAS